MKGHATSNRRLLLCLVLLVGLILVIMVVDRLPAYLFVWSLATMPPPPPLPTEAEVEAFDAELDKAAAEADAEILGDDHK